MTTASGAASRNPRNLVSASSRPRGVASAAGSSRAPRGCEPSARTDPRDSPTGSGAGCVALSIIIRDQPSAGSAEPDAQAQCTSAKSDEAIDHGEVIRILLDRIVNTASDCCRTSGEAQWLAWKQ